MKYTQRLRPWGLPRHAPALLLFVSALLIGAFSIDAGAQPAQDPPGRVARLAESEGQVWFYSPDSGEWVSAVRNQPVTSGDRVATDAGARAELQLGSTTVRLGESTEYEVVQLDDDHFATQLHNGSVAAHLRDANSAGQFELTTDEGRFVADRVGSYRFDRSDGASWVTVLNGQARYEGTNSALTVHAGQRAEFWIDSGGVAQYNLGTPVNDAFSAWDSERDRLTPRRVSAARYVSPEMTGAAELDRYGRWEETPEYGAIWYPASVDVDWAPYSRGHWAWVRPWGWTWIDDAPWGFAPFHYGRWVHFRNRWCWTPGRRVERPVYAPALVAWIGGPRVDIGISIGGRGPAVGWFPLAPREVYVPSYRSSPRYVQNVNITNVTNVTQITNVINNPQAPREFTNRRLPNAVTVVPATVMTGRQPVAPAAAQLRKAPEVRQLLTQQQQPTRIAALVAPPVAAPSAPARALERREVRPPPGAAPDAGRRAGQIMRPDAASGGRDGGRPELARPGQPAVQPGITAPAPGPARPGESAATVTPARPVTPASVAPGGRLERADERRGAAAAGEPPKPAAAPALNAARPAPTQPAASPQSPQEGPIARPQPAARGDEQRATPTAPEARGPTPRIERPGAVPPPPRSGDAARAAESPRANPIERPRPAEVQRPTPAAPRGEPESRGAEVQRPAPALRPVEPPRAAEVQRPAPPQRPVEPPRAAEVQRTAPPRAAEVQRPEPPQRPVEPPRAVEVQRAAPPQRPVEAQHPVPAAAPHPEARRPEPRQRPEAAKESQEQRRFDPRDQQK